MQQSKKGRGGTIERNPSKRTCGQVLFLIKMAEGGRLMYDKCQKNIETDIYTRFEIEISHARVHAENFLQAVLKEAFTIA